MSSRGAARGRRGWWLGCGWMLGGCLVAAPDRPLTGTEEGDDLRPAPAKYSAEDLADAPRWRGRFVGPCDGPVPMHLVAPGGTEVLVRIEATAREYELPLPPGEAVWLRYGCDGDQDGRVPASEVQTVAVRGEESREVDLPLPFPEGAGLDLRVRDRVSTPFVAGPAGAVPAPPPTAPPTAPPAPTGSPTPPGPDGGVSVPGAPPPAAGTPGSTGAPPSPGGPPAPPGPPPGPPPGAAAPPAPGSSEPPAGAAGAPGSSPPAPASPAG